MDINNKERDFDRTTLLLNLSEKININKDILKSIDILAEENDFYKEDILYDIFDIFKQGMFSNYHEIKHLGAIDEYFEDFKNLNDDEFLKEIQITINYIINAHLMVYISVRKHMTFRNTNIFIKDFEDVNDYFKFCGKDIFHIVMYDLEGFCSRFKENPPCNKDGFYISRDELKKELYIKVNVACYNLIMFNEAGVLHFYS